MNHRLGFLAFSAIVLTLAACGGGDDNQPKVNVDDLAAGTYVVSTGDADAPTVGKYYAGADGSRLLVLPDSTDHASQLYRRNAGAAWAAVPAPGRDVTVTLLRSSATTASTLAVASVAGSYVAQVGTGVAASFTVNAAGDITAGATACKLSGKLSAGTLPNTLQLSLATTACGALPASATGVLAVDADYAPASFRLVADNGAQVVDLWAYAE
ncbi:MAG: hypothetical protein JWQ88_3020 [Rhodoferax sp.]|nr:hypothetical protein [Rhodoferax sp.]